MDLSSAVIPEWNPAMPVLTLSRGKLWHASADRQSKSEREDEPLHSEPGRQRRTLDHWFGRSGCDLVELTWVFGSNSSN